jgi:tetratricopeptide (TPR) repeat protein
MSETLVAAPVGEDQLPPNLKSLWTKALAAAEAKNYGYAVTIAQSILAQEPRFLVGRRLARNAAVKNKAKDAGRKGLKLTSGGLGVMQIKNQAKKDPNAALVALEKALAEDPYNTQANELLHDIAVDQGMVDTAAFALETIFEGHPENKKVGHRLGDYFMSHGLANRAAAIFSAMAKRDPTDLAASQKLIAATAQDSMKKNQWSEQTSMKDLIKNKDEAQKLEMKSRTGMTRDQIAEQIDHYLERYNANQNDLANVKALADLYEQYEDFHSALQFYEWAHHLSKGDTALQAKVQRLRARIRDIEIHELEADLENQPDSEKEEQLRQLKHARSEIRIREAKAGVDRNPTDPQLRFELGSAYFEDELYSEAIQELQRAKNSPHIRIRVLFMLGKCFEAKGMHDLAITQLENAAEELNVMDHLKKDVLYTLGVIYEGMGNKEKSMEALKQIYEADYGYRDVAKRVEASYAE